MVDRSLWGTDWTRTFTVVNYEQGVEPFLKTDRLSDTERAMLMGGACARSAMKGGCAKNAPNPPQPSTARPRKSALETTAIRAIRRCSPSMAAIQLSLG